MDLLSNLDSDSVTVTTTDPLGFPQTGFGTQGGIVPPIGETTQAIKKQCGPDITQDFIDRLAEFVLNVLKNSFKVSKKKHKKKAKNLTLNPPTVRDPLNAIDLYKLCGPGVDGVNYKNRRGENKNCPVNCAETVMLCGHCIRDDVPGNIGQQYT